MYNVKNLGPSKMNKKLPFVFINRSFKQEKLRESFIGKACRGVEGNTGIHNIDYWDYNSDNNSVSTFVIC